MKILITGGNGYIGGRLSEFLTTFSRYQVISLSRKNYSGINRGIERRSIDWTSDLSLASACSGIDIIVHLAGMNAQDCAVNPADALVVNGVYSKRLLEAAIMAGVRRFIYVSTAHVYGSALQNIVSEITYPRPIHPYATSHRVAEHAVLTAVNQRSIEGFVLRLSNSFGRPASAATNCWSLLFNDLSRQSVTHNKLILKTSGLQRRDFIPMSDVCRAILHFIDLEFQPDGHSIFNVGGRWSPTVFEVATLIASRYEVLTGHKLEIQRNQSDITEKSNDLSYSIEYLNASGFELRMNPNDELDQLLTFCISEFGNPNE